MADELLVTPIVVRRGELQSSPSPFITSFTGRGSLDGVSFHAMVETAASDAEPVSKRLLSALQKSLSGTARLSLTSSLSGGIQAGHRELLAANEQASLATRVGAGVTCLALRGRDVVMARAGPGTIYLRDAHGVRALEPPRADDAPRDAEGAAQLGMAAVEVPVALDRHAVAPGEVLLSANSSLGRSVSYDGLVAILSATPQEAASKLALVMQEAPFFAALLVSPA